MSLEDNDTQAELPPDQPLLERLRIRILQLEGQVESREQLLRITSHELRNPIHAIGLQIDAAHQLAASRGDRILTERLEQVDKALQWFLKRCTVMLDLSKMASGLQRLELGKVDLREVIGHVTDLYVPQSLLYEAPLYIECSGDLMGSWDALALEQALGNLVSNALKFGAGAPVVITALEADSAVVKIQVVDRGGGISVTQQELMNCEFSEVMRHSDLSKGGFGGGLWLARNLVEAHGGYIEIFSVPGSGTTFSVYLPRSSQPIRTASDTPRSS